MCCLGGADGYACKTERGWQVLMATGRKAKTKDIGLEEISVELDEKGWRQGATLHTASVHALCSCI